MENPEQINSIAGQLQLLLETNQEFPLKLKQHLLLESNSVKNPFQFIVTLLTEGVLSDGSSDLDAICGLKEIIVQLAVMIACSKGADAIGGLMKALDESGNSHLVSALCTRVKEEFGIETVGDLSEPTKSAPVLRTGPSEMFPKKGKNSKEMNSPGTKLIDKIISQVNEQLLEQFEGHLVSKASTILNAPLICSSLVHQNVLDERDYQLKSTPKSERKQRAEKAIKAACSKKAIGSLILALQSSENEHIIAEAYEWIEVSPLRKKNYPIAIKSLAGNKEEPTFFKQDPISDGLSKIATFKWEQKSAATGISAVQFDKYRIVACSAANRVLNLWNSRGNEEEKISSAVKVKDITCFQYDEQVLILGTAEGTVHLFDAKTFKEKWLVRFGNSVIALEFFESALVILTRSVVQKQAWWMEISRPDMRLLNQKSLFSWKCYINQIDRVYMYADYTFVHSADNVYVYDTRSGGWIAEDDEELFCLTAPASISTLYVGDLVSFKRVVVAGCNDGVIATPWSI